MAKHAAVQFRTHLRIRRWCEFLMERADDPVRPVRLSYTFVGADGERSRQRRRSATDAAYPLRVHIGPANIWNHRRIRRWPVISTAGCFALSLRGNCFRWERCLHAGGAVVQLCRKSSVCWPQCPLRGSSVAPRYNPIRIQRLFLHTFSDKPEKVCRRRHSCGVTASTAVR